MAEFTRRDVLIGGAVIAGSAMLSGPFQVLAAPGAGGATRYNVNSPQGKQMLAIYARAVEKMMDTRLYPLGNPLNWTFQWYTHFVPGNTTKEQEIARIYPAGGANKALAERMWDTCQAHSDGQREDFFLPWHRMYVAAFEAIIRQVAAEPTFTLPYWDYTDYAQQALPEEFRRPDDPQWGALYRANRWENSNQGGKVSDGPKKLQLTLDCMMSAGYSAGNGDKGFCARTDSNPHGALHLDVGNELGMAEVPWAANDPIFWLHHCNVDRIWASWNRAGGINPSDRAFLDTRFVFATPQGDPLLGQVSDFLAVPESAYSVYLERPQGSVPFPVKGKLMQAAAPALQAKTSRVMLSHSATTVTLELQAGGVMSADGQANFSGRLQQATAQPRHVWLGFEGLSAPGAVLGGYNVFVHGATPGELTPQSASYVGQINFFGVPGSHGHAGHSDGAGGLVAQPKAYSLLLNQRTLDALIAGRVTAPEVTLIPAGEGNTGAVPVIENITFSVE